MFSRRLLTYLLLFAGIYWVLSGGCSSGYEKTPVDKLITQLQDKHEAFSIILHNMKTEGTFFTKYFHQYKVITGTGKDIDERITDWQEVEEAYFQRHESNLGLTLASKTEDGELNRTVAPPGYYNYVGNSKYGQFVERDGTSFWEFYGQYAFLSSMLNLASDPPIEDDYFKWKRKYRGRKPYYGPKSGSSYKYGTYSKTTRRQRPDFYERRRRSSGWSKSKPSSGGTYGSGIRRSGGRYSSGSSGGSSFRSRGGGFGK
jgi:uncharacterized membrane protein YgcG